MRNHIADLNDYLFETIERLMDDDQGTENLEMEIKKADAVTRVASNIIKGAELVLRAEEQKARRGSAPTVILGDDQGRKMLK